jgi:hypothetical protein
VVYVIKWFMSSSGLCHQVVYVIKWFMSSSGTVRNRQKEGMARRAEKKPIEAEMTQSVQMTMATIFH